MIVQETRIRTSSGHQPFPGTCYKAQGTKPYVFCVAVTGALRTG